MRTRNEYWGVSDRRVADDVVLAALVLAYGASSHQTESAGWQVPAGLAAAASAVAVARARGASWEELGLEPDAIPAGVRFGVATLAPLGAVIALGLAVPATRRFFADERVGVSSGRELAYDTFVRIPLGTATTEEVLFRSALLGIALHRHGRTRAVLASAVAFGLWHVIPALRSHESNPEGARLANRVGGRPATVAATVAATSIAGAGFAWLRLRSRSVAAPIIVHAGVNVAGLLAASWTARRAASARS
jgi:membrane protease YdiL (CAAX protease family)